MDVVDTGDGGPEFVLTVPRGGPSGLAARVGEGPLVGRHTGRRVRGVFERVIRAVELAGFDCGEFTMDGEHGVAVRKKVRPTHSHIFSFSTHCTVFR